MMMSKQSKAKQSKNRPKGKGPKGKARAAQPVPLWVNYIIVRYVLY